MKPFTEFMIFGTIAFGLFFALTVLASWSMHRRDVRECEKTFSPAFCEAKFK